MKILVPDPLLEEARSSVRPPSEERIKELLDKGLKLRRDTSDMYIAENKINEKNLRFLLK